MKTSNETLLEIRKAFPVPKEKLYQAWTRPQDLKQWWKPLNSNLEEVSLDVRKNGKIKYVFKNPDVSFTINGEYLEVKEGEKLVYTWNWEMHDKLSENGTYKLTVVFQDREGGSSLTVIQESMENEEALFPHQKGWNKTLNDLYHYLERTA